MSSNIRWGIIGLGKIANKFAEAISNVEGAELYAVASRNLESAEQFASKYKIDYHYGSYEQLINDPKVDIVYVATPHAFHREQTLLCLNNKKPVLCEKPLAHKYSDVKAMIETSHSNNVFLMEAMWTKFLPPTHKALELIREGLIGEVKKVKADFGFKSPFDPKSRLYDMALGGGSLMDVGVYPLALTLTVLGVPLGFNSKAKLSSTGADENFHAVLSYPNAEAEISSSIIENTNLEAEIIGTKGSIKFKSPWYKLTSLILIKSNGTNQEFSFDYSSSNGFEYQIIDAMNCLKEGKNESTIMPHGFSLMQSRMLDGFCEQCGIKY